MCGVCVCICAGGGGGIVYGRGGLVFICCFVLYLSCIEDEDEDEDGYEDHAG